MFASKVALGLNTLWPFVLDVVTNGLMRLSVVIKRSYARVSGGFVLVSYKVTKRGNGGFYVLIYLLLVLCLYQDGHTVRLSVSVEECDRQIRLHSCLHSGLLWGFIFYFLNKCGYGDKFSACAEVIALIIYCGQAITDYALR